MSNPDKMTAWAAGIAVALIVFAIALIIASPLINGLTTGATPTISPTSTTGTLVGYVLLFVVLAFILFILYGALSHRVGGRQRYFSMTDVAKLGKAIEYMNNAFNNFPKVVQLYRY
jgi:ABC-type uncharacterized transport system YnjBCD permease subunit